MKTIKCKECSQKIVWEIFLDSIWWKYCSKAHRLEYSRAKIRKQKEKKEAKKQKLKEKRATSPKKLYKENVEMAKLIAKIRDWYICQWCWKDWNSNKADIHWSHIINEARDHRLATNELNIKALCYHCHMNLWHKDPVLASEWFNKKFPWRYEELNKLYIENWKSWPLWRIWHIAENARLKSLLIYYKKQYNIQD